MFSTCLKYTCTTAREQIAAVSKESETAKISALGERKKREEIEQKYNELLKGSSIILEQKYNDLLKGRTKYLLN